MYTYSQGLSQHFERQWYSEPEMGFSICCLGYCPLQACEEIMTGVCPPTPSTSTRSRKGSEADQVGFQWTEKCRAGTVNQVGTKPVSGTLIIRGTPYKENCPTQHWLPRPDVCKQGHNEVPCCTSFLRLQVTNPPMSRSWIKLNILPKADGGCCG